MQNYNRELGDLAKMMVSNGDTTIIVQTFSVPEISSFWSRISEKYDNKILQKWETYF